MDIFGWKTMAEVLEQQIRQQREDFMGQLREKDAEIRRLRAEKVSARMGTQAMQAVVVNTPKAKDFVVPAAPGYWGAELNKMLQEEEDGIRERGRIQVNESGTHDGAQAVDGAQVDGGRSRTGD
jgi:hypothetical protein